MSRQLCRLSYFYPRPPRGGRLKVNDFEPTTMGISIHALREEGDVHHVNHVKDAPDFYPRPPRGGRPQLFEYTGMRLGISIHALREEGDVCARHPAADHGRISIHALREEGDPIVSSVSENRLKFLSTPSARRATVSQVDSGKDNFISIHALREEGDIFSVKVSSSSTYFYPRPPRGGRP